MARRKPKNLFPIKNLAQANQALAEIAVLKRRIEAVNARLNDEIDRLKAQAEAEAAPLASRLESLENGLLAFAEFNKDELFKDRRSRELDYGTLGYRRSTQLKPMPRHTWAMVLGKIEELGFSEAVRVKKDVDREALRTWPDERLELVGARRVEKDTFWYEVKEEEILPDAA